MKTVGTSTLRRSLAQDRSSTYVELTKPRITAMVLLTVAIGFVMAPVPGHAISLLHVLVGAFLSCSGAGALNQYIERDTDAVMARTRFRPLPAHRVSPFAVFALGTVLAAGGVLYLLATTNAVTALLDGLTLATYLFVYTPLKRISPLSTLAGAIPGALPPMMGWAAATGDLAEGAWILFAILFLWQIPHFLAIGRMYREDYVSGGFPMLVVVDRDGKTTGRQMVLYALALVPVALLPTTVGLTGTIYFWTALAAGLGYLGASVNAAHRGDQRSARTLLLVSVVYLPILFTAMFLDGIAG
jgi:protoheme IX farnesyltransferase